MKVSAGKDAPARRAGRTVVTNDACVTFGVEARGCVLGTHERTCQSSPTKLTPHFGRFLKVESELVMKAVTWSGASRRTVITSLEYAIAKECCQVGATNSNLKQAIRCHFPN